MAKILHKPSGCCCYYWILAVEAVDIVGAVIFNLKPTVLQVWFDYERCPVWGSNPQHTP